MRNTHALKVNGNIRIDFLTKVSTALLEYKATSIAAI